MRLFIFLIALLFSINTVSAFQDECSSEAGIVNTFQALYNDARNKAIMDMKELDPAMEALEIQIQEIKSRVDIELDGSTSSRIAIEKINRTKELTEKLLILSQKQDSYMKSIANYETMLNKALNNLYICRYNVMVGLLDGINNPSLSYDSKLQLLNSAYYYADNEKYKSLILGYIEQLKLQSVSQKSINPSYQVDVSTVDKKSVSIKKKAQIQLDRYKKQYASFSKETQKAKYEKLIIILENRKKILRGDVLSVNNKLIELINLELLRLK